MGTPAATRKARNFVHLQRKKKVEWQWMFPALASAGVAASVLLPVRNGRGITGGLLLAGVSSATSRCPHQFTNLRVFLRRPLWSWLLPAILHKAFIASFAQPGKRASGSGPSPRCAVSAVEVLLLR